MTDETNRDIAYRTILRLHQENAALRAALESLSQELAWFLEYLCGPQEEDPTSYYEAAERALSEAGATLSAITVRDQPNRGQ